MAKIAGVILLVDNIEDSVAFYTKLGFQVSKEISDTATKVSLGEFWVELLHKDKVVSEEYKEDSTNPTKGAGIYLQIEVQDIDAFHDSIVSNGIQVSGKPENFPWKQREFIVEDPDGYKLAFFCLI